MKGARSEEACLVQIYGPSLGHKYELQSEEVVVGRDEGCAIVVELDTVSRRHCSFLLRPEGAFVRDDPAYAGDSPDHQLRDA